MPTYKEDSMNLSKFLSILSINLIALGTFNIHSQAYAMEKPSVIIVDPNVLNTKNSYDITVALGTAFSLITGSNFNTVFRRFPVLLRPFSLIHDGHSIMQEKHGMYNVVNEVNNKLVAKGYKKLSTLEMQKIVRLICERLWQLDDQTKHLLQQAKNQGIHLILATNQDPIEYSFLLHLFKKRFGWDLQRLFEKIFIIEQEDSKAFNLSWHNVEIISEQNPSQRYIDIVAQQFPEQKVIWFMGELEYEKLIQSDLIIPHNISIVCCDHAQLLIALNQLL